MIRNQYKVITQATLDNLNLRAARVYPLSTGIYIDTVSVRSEMPKNYGDKYLETFRRIQPSIQYMAGSLAVTKSGTDGNRKINISFKTRNCAINLPNFTLIDSFPANNSTLTKLSSSSPPVTGSFNLSWNDGKLNGI